MKILTFLPIGPVTLREPTPKKEIVGTPKAAEMCPKPLSAANAYLQSEIRMIDCRSVYLPQIDFIDNFWHESIRFFPFCISFLDPKTR